MFLHFLYFLLPFLFLFFFFNATATTEIYTLSLHDALPILFKRARRMSVSSAPRIRGPRLTGGPPTIRSEEHTSELQSLRHLVCRLLLEKKKKKKRKIKTSYTEKKTETKNDT